MSENGLNYDQIDQKLEQFGHNELPEKPLPGNISLILSQLKSPLVYVLLVAAIVTFLLHDSADAVVIGIAVFINTVLGFVQEKRAGQALKALQELVHPLAQVVRQGEVQTIPAREIVPDDVVVLNSGDKVPADGILLEANRFFANEAMLTGESVPISKPKDAEVFMGTVVTAGQAKFVVRETGVNTEIGKIAQSLDSIQQDTPLKQQLERFSKQLSILTLGLTAVIFVVGMLLGSSPREIFTVSVALAVSAIPEGLLVGLTVVLAIGMQRILANQGLVRNLVSAETLGGVTTICVDKTGTLTQGKMQVTDVIGDEADLKLQTVIANDLDDPIVVAAYEWGSQEGTVDEGRYERLDSIPFSSENKFFASLHKLDEKHNLLLVNGAPEVLVENSELNDESKELLREQIDNLSGHGKRILGFAKKLVPASLEKLEDDKVVVDLEWEGMIAFSDPVRVDVKDSLKKAFQAGIKLVVITGDYQKTAVSILQQIGITVPEENIILGPVLEKMSDADLEKRLFANEQVKLFARTKPEQKLKIVQVLKGHDEVIAMMGDGVNDAPALKAADIGIVVGEGTDVAKESADLVLLDSSFKTIVLAIEEGRGIFDNLRKMILYLMSDAFEEIFLVTFSLIAGLPIPITAAQILWVNLISDGFPNLALTVDPKSPEVMSQRPRSPKELLVNPWMQKLILIGSLTGGIITFGVFYYVLKTTEDVVLARSVAFALVGINSLPYAFSIKALKVPFWKADLLNNRWLILAVFGGLIMQLIPFTFAPLRELFSLVQLGPYWIVVGVAAFVMVGIIEIAKLGIRDTPARH